MEAHVNNKSRDSNKNVTNVLIKQEIAAKGVKLGSIMPVEESREEPLSSYFIGKKEDIIQAKKVSKSVNGRDILVIYHMGKFYAMDRHCYREYRRLGLATSGVV